MPTIAKVPTKSGVRWKAIIKRQGRILTTKTFRTKTNAREWAKRIESDLELVRALGLPGAALTLEQLATEYLMHWKGKDTAVNTRAQWWVTQIGTHKLTDINVTLIRNKLDHYAEGNALRGNRTPGTQSSTVTETNRTRSPATVNRMKAMISTLLQYAIQQGYIMSNSARNVPNRPESNKRVRWLSDIERIHLLNSCRESSWNKLYLLVLLAITTGARQGELLKLRWEDINCKTRLASVYDSKNGDDRILTLPISVIEELLRHRLPDGLLFESIRNPGSPFEFRKHWEAALLRAGVKYFRFHDLRHTAASYLVQSGATLYEVGEILGHRSLETTKRYAHLSTQHKQILTDNVFGQMTIQSN